MPLNKKNYLLRSAAVLLLAGFAAAGYAQQDVHNGHIRNMICLTTQTSLKLELTFDSLPPMNTAFQLKISEKDNSAVLLDAAIKPSGTVKEKNKLIFYVANLTPREWMPTDPELYDLKLTVSAPGKENEMKVQTIGFRYFESKNGNLYLNGKPIFLRGIAINPPDRGIPDSIEKSRKFADDYIRYMKSIHVNIIRIPNDETWYSACDALGMMVFGGNYSGTVDGKKPPEDYDKAVDWYENKAFAMIASHPSLMVYAMTNEVPFTGEIAIRWENFLSYAYSKLKAWDSTRVYIANAGYGYGKSGDICDLHRYWGWYYCSPFTFLHARYNEDIVPFKKPVEPITFTECVGNYTGPDGRYNLTPAHKNPGSQLNWTGHADEMVQAKLADAHQSLTFREATELLRRMRNINPELSGVFPFTILFYNWNNVQRFIDMGPKPVTRQVRLSYQPILLSWENWTTQVYSGTVIQPIVHIINDDDSFQDLNHAKLIYQLTDETNTALVTDTLDLPLIPYYGSWQKKVLISLPPDIPTGHYRLTGKILGGNRIVSENTDLLFVSDRSYTSSVVTPKQKILLYDPSGKAMEFLDKISLHYQKLKPSDQISLSSILVIGENAMDKAMLERAPSLKRFVEKGGRILCLRQDAEHLPAVNKLLGSPVKNITTALDIPVYPPPPRPSRMGYYVNPERPGHPVFDGVSREELKVWSDYTGWDESQKGFPAIYPVTDGYVPENKSDMKNIAVLGDFGPALEGIAVAEIFDGKGSVLLCGLDLVNRSLKDPVADRVFVNLISYTGNGEKHNRYPLVTAPIVWGDFTSEKGLLTGINSGLMLNGKPRIPENNKSKITLTQEGDMFLGARGGFNTRPGIQYIPYGRRMYGPYHLKGFGDTPVPDAENNHIGEGTFWCSVPEEKRNSSTLVWNPSGESLSVTVFVNDQTVSKVVEAGKTIRLDCPVHSTDLKMGFTGDRRLVILETSFR